MYGYVPVHIIWTLIVFNWWVVFRYRQSTVYWETSQQQINNTTSTGELQVSIILFPVRPVQWRHWPRHRSLLVNACTNNNVTSRHQTAQVSLLRLSADSGWFVQVISRVFTLHARILYTGVVTLPSVWVRCIVIILSVCLSACPLAYLKNHTVYISPNFLYMLPMVVARSFSEDNAIGYVLPVLWTTSFFHIMERMGRIRDEVYVSSSSPGGSTKGEVCRFRLHFVLSEEHI